MGKAYDINDDSLVVGQHAFTGVGWKGFVYDTHTGDVNYDCVVDIHDVLLLIGAWGPCDDGAICPGDLTGNGTVGVADLLILIGNWD